MILIERMIQEIHNGKSQELEDLDKRYQPVEKRLGFPPSKRFWTVSGVHTMATIVIEREWESMAAFEEAFNRAFADPEWQALNEAGVDIVKSSRMEFYTPMT